MIIALCGIICKLTLAAASVDKVSFTYSPVFDASNSENVHALIYLKVIWESFKSVLLIDHCCLFWAATKAEFDGRRDTSSCHFPDEMMSKFKY